MRGVSLVPFQSIREIMCRFMAASSFFLRSIPRNGLGPDQRAKFRVVEQHPAHGGGTPQLSETIGLLAGLNTLTEVNESLTHLQHSAAICAWNPTRIAPGLRLS